MVILLLLAAGVAFAQQGNSPSRSLGELLREDGTVDLNRSHEGAVDLSGFNVIMGSDGMLRARAEGDGQWLPGEHAAGVNGRVYALAWGPDGALYVGGDFTAAGGIPGTSGIARFTPEDEGGTWSALSSGLNSAVHALAWGPDGALYVSGEFTSAGGVEGADHIARWMPSGSEDGAWSHLGGGVNDEVRAMAWGPDGALYVGGGFTAAGDVTDANRIARWTPDEAGGTWSTLGSGVDGFVATLAWGPDGALYVGGGFTAAGDVTDANRIARWTPDEAGGTWSTLGSGVDGFVATLAWGPDGSLYLGGSFNSAGGVWGVYRIARWTPDENGGAWSALGAGVKHPVETLAWGPDGALYVGGWFTMAGENEDVNHVARWTPDGPTGGAWSALGSGVNNWVYALAWGPDGALYVGGTFSSAGGVAGARRIVRWVPDETGGTWRAVGAGWDGAVSALAWGPDGALYVGGTFTSVLGIAGTSRIARWTPDGMGGAWSALGSGLEGGERTVRALAWGPDGALYVGGNFTSASGVANTSSLARWTPDGADGGAWSALGTGVGGLVWALAWGPDGALYVGGNFTSAGGIEGIRSIARWTPDGASGTWSALGSGVSGLVTTLAWGPDDALYVGGGFTSAGGNAGMDYVARWTPDENGGAWSALGSGVGSSVYALVWGPDGALYVGGSFLSAGGIAGASNIARWTPDGTGGTWSALGSGMNGAGLALGWGTDGALYVGGTFTSASGVAGTTYVARWTPGGAGGGAWSDVGSGVNGIVRAIEWGADDILYVGGDLTIAGGVTSANFARWTGNTTSAESDAPRSASLAFEAAYPNPFTTRTTFVFSVAAPSEVHLAVYDVLGRRVATLAEEHVGAGTHERVFDGSRLPNGTYLVRLSSGGESQTRRVLLVR